MKVALVHDHLMQLGGAERVLAAFAETFPEAPVYTLMYDSAVVANVVDEKRLRSTKLQKLPFRRWTYRASLPLMPSAIESLDLTEYDVVLSSASSFAKGVKVREGAVHLCYCHTPPRYLWNDADQYVASLLYPRFVKKIITSIVPWLRSWDFAAAQKVTHFIANSHEVSNRIQRYYGKKSTVLYPPVTLRVKPRSETQSYYLTGGRLVQYKRFDTVIDAFTRLRLPLVVYGNGPDLARLKARAGSNVVFVDRVSDEEVASLYSEAFAFIHPQLEDFGITVIEAMASGCPVIAYNRGGAAESIIDGVTGVLYDEQSWEAIGDAVIRFKTDNFSATKIKSRGESFSKENFQRHLRELVEQAYASRN